LSSCLSAPSLERTLTRVRVKEVNMAKYWMMYLYNFLTKFRWHEVPGLEDHPLIWATSEVPGDEPGDEALGSGTRAKRYV
jgi:hypothetical protein